MQGILVMLFCFLLVLGRAARLAAIVVRNKLSEGNIGRTSHRAGARGVKDSEVTASGSAVLGVGW